MSARTGVLVLLFPALLGAAANDWPLFRGDPQQTGIAASRLADRLEILWQFKTDDAFENAVAVKDGVVFAGCMNEHLYAIDLATGKEKWKYKAGSFKAAPAVKGNQIFIGDLDGNFHAIDSATGKKKWSFDAGGAELGGANFHGDQILFASHDENLYCLSAEGALKWKFKTEGPIYGAPAVADGKTFLVGCDSQMHVIDIPTGKELRAVNLGGQTGATAGVKGNQLYVGTMSNEVKALDWVKGTEVWSYQPENRPRAFFSSPAVNDKLVVIGARDSRVHCIDRKTGKAVWTFPTGRDVDSSPVIAGSRVVVGSLDSKLYVLDLESGKQLQTFPLDGPISASPVIVDGKVLIGTQKGTLYCLGEKK